MCSKRNNINKNKNTTNNNNEKKKKRNSRNKIPKIYAEKKYLQLFNTISHHCYKIQEFNGFVKPGLIFESWICCSQAGSAVALVYGFGWAACSQAHYSLWQFGFPVNDCLLLTKQCMNECAVQFVWKRMPKCCRNEIEKKKSKKIEKNIENICLTFLASCDKCHNFELLNVGWQKSYYHRCGLMSLLLGGQAITSNITFH